LNFTEKATRSLGDFGGRRAGTVPAAATPIAIDVQAGTGLPKKDVDGTEPIEPPR